MLVPRVLVLVTADGLASRSGLSAHTQLPPGPLLRLHHLSVQRLVVGLLRRTDLHHLVLDRIVLVVEVEVGGDDRGDDGDYGEDEGGEEEVVHCGLVGWGVSAGAQKGDGPQ